MDLNRRIGIYQRAIELLEERGWGQGAYLLPGGQLCVLGALDMAAGESVDLSLPVCLSLHDLLSPLSNLVGNNPASWNDEPGRSAEQVIAVLRAVIDQLQAEQEASRMEPVLA